MSKELQGESYLLFHFLCRSQQYNHNLPSVDKYMKTNGHGTNAACKAGIEIICERDPGSGDYFDPAFLLERQTNPGCCLTSTSFHSL